MNHVIEHLESYVGEIAGGHSFLPDGSKAPFHVVQASDGPIPGLTTFATLGLCRFPLARLGACEDDHMVRQELVMVAPTDAVPANLPALVQQVGMGALARGAAFSNGEIIGPKGALFQGFEPTALVAAQPYCFPEGFAAVDDSEERHVEFLWLVPLHTDEVTLIQSQGWEGFERFLAHESVYYTDYRRSV